METCEKINVNQFSVSECSRLWSLISKWIQQSSLFCDANANLGDVSRKLMVMMMKEMRGPRQCSGGHLFLFLRSVLFSPRLRPWKPEWWALPLSACWMWWWRKADTHAKEKKKRIWSWESRCFVLGLPYVLPYTLGYIIECSQEWLKYYFTTTAINRWERAWLDSEASLPWGGCTSLPGSQAWSLRASTQQILLNQKYIDP